MGIQHEIVQLECIKTPDVIFGGRGITAVIVSL